jgi:hypothetical protein
VPDKKPRKPPLRSRSLLGGEKPFVSDAPFRHNFTMQFPLREQRALQLLAKMLFFKEDLLNEHFPLFRGSHNLAHVRAAILDFLAIARSLANVAAFRDTELSSRERAAAELADRFAVKAARLAAEMSGAMDELAKPKSKPSAEQLRRRSSRKR